MIWVLFCMLYLYYGENSFLLQEKLAAIKTRYQAKFSSGLNFWRMDAAEGWGDLKNAMEIQSMFEEKKLIFLRGVLTINESDWSEVKKILECNAVSGSEVVLICYDFITPPAEARKKEDAISPAVQKRLDFFKQAQAKIEEFKNFSRLELARWAVKKTASAGLKIKRGDLEYLADLVFPDIQRMNNEIEKLAVFQSGQEISRLDIDILVSGDVSANIFKTTDALARRDVKTALASLEEHWQKNEDPLGIFNMLVWQFRILVKLASLNAQNFSAAAAAKRLKINPWTAEKSLAAARRFGYEEMKNAYQRLADIDLAVKTGREDAREALTDFVYGFLPRKTTLTN